MQIGVLKEIKTKEHRVSVTPEGVEQMREHGHEVRVETGAGAGSDCSNKEYESNLAIHKMRLKKGGHIRQIRMVLQTRVLHCTILCFL